MRALKRPTGRYPFHRYANGEAPVRIYAHRRAAVDVTPDHGNNCSVEDSTHPCLYPHSQADRAQERMIALLSN